MFSIDWFFPLYNFIAEEGDDAADGLGDKKEGVRGLIDVSLFWEVGDDGSETASE